MDFGKAITFPFDDDDWIKKLLIGFVVAFVPFVQLALTGWQVKLIRNVKHGDEQPLPAWDDFGSHWVKGFLATLAVFIYQIPTIIFMIVASGAISATVDTDIAAIGIIIAACCGCIAFFYLIVSLATYFGGLIRFAETETFGTFMQFGANFGLVRNNLGEVFTAWLYIIIASVVAGALPFIGIIIYTYINGHIMGQLAGQLKEGGAPAPAV